MGTFNGHDKLSPAAAAAYALMLKASENRLRSEYGIKIQSDYNSDLENSIKTSDAELLSSRTDLMTKRASRETEKTAVVHLKDKNKIKRTHKEEMEDLKKSKAAKLQRQQLSREKNGRTYKEWLEEAKSVRDAKYHRLMQIPLAKAHLEIKNHLVEKKPAVVKMELSVNQKKDEQIQVRKAAEKNWKQFTSSVVQLAEMYVKDKKKAEEAKKIAEAKAEAALKRSQAEEANRRVRFAAVEPVRKTDHQSGGVGLLRASGILTSNRFNYGGYKISSHLGSMSKSHENAARRSEFADLDFAKLMKETEERARQRMLERNMNRPPYYFPAKKVKLDINARVGVPDEQMDSGLRKEDRETETVKAAPESQSSAQPVSSMNFGAPSNKVTTQGPAVKPRGLITPSLSQENRRITVQIPVSGKMKDSTLIQHSSGSTQEQPNDSFVGEADANNGPFLSPVPKNNVRQLASNLPAEMAKVHIIEQPKEKNLLEKSVRKAESTPINGMSKGKKLEIIVSLPECLKASLKPSAPHLNITPPVSEKSSDQSFKSFGSSNGNVTEDNDCEKPSYQAELTPNQVESKDRDYEQFTAIEKSAEEKDTSFANLFKVKYPYELEPEEKQSQQSFFGNLLSVNSPPSLSMTPQKDSSFDFFTMPLEGSKGFFSLPGNGSFF